MDIKRKNLIFDIVALGVSAGIVAILFVGTNISSLKSWNEGFCPNCNRRYDLKAVSKGLKYYACPVCGKEVQRF